MIRLIGFGILDDLPDKQKAEDWYKYTHAPEFKRWYGAWLRRWESFKIVDPPQPLITAYESKYGLKSGRYTEMWWTSEQEFLESKFMQEVKTYTDSDPNLPDVIPPFVFTTAKPDYEFFGNELSPQTPVFRWVRAFRIGFDPQGVSGKALYPNIYAEAVKKLKKHRPLKFIAYKSLNLLPSSAWDYVDELWFANFSDWDAFCKDSSIPALLVKGGDMVSNFVNFYPDIDFLNPEIPFFPPYVVSGFNLDILKATIELPAN